MTFLSFLNRITAFFRPTPKQKPSLIWDFAPTWAHYLAQDQSGDWHWFQHEPGLNESNQWLPSKGRVKSADGFDESPPDQPKLRQRPGLMP